MKKFILAIIIIASIAGGGLYVWKNKTVSMHDHAHEIYQCSMHPQIVQDHPGSCPICGMRLNRVSEKASGDPVLPSNKQGRKITFYRHPMRPDVTSPVPAKDEMGMDYIPVYEEATGDKMPASDVGGHAAVKLTADKVQLIGIRTEEAKMKKLILPLRVTGTVFYNQQIANMLMAYRDAIQVNQRVKKPTYEVVTQARAQAWTLRNQLRRIGIDNQAFKQAEQGLTDPSQFIPANLILTASGVYIDARLSVADAMHLMIGQKVKLSLPSSSEYTAEGVVISVDSVVDTSTQTVAIRIEVQSDNKWIKPGLFVNVEMELDLGERLVIPNTAIFNPGKEAYIFIEQAPGIYVPHHIETGITTGESTEVLKGVADGDKVAVSANFLLDSESRFRAAALGGQS